MGAGASKPEGASKHVFSSDTPVQFSKELVDSLQSSSETNSSRAKSLELHIASRVAEELSALQKKQDEALTSLREHLSPKTEPSSSSKSDSFPIPGSATKSSPSSSSSSKDKKDDKGPSSSAVFAQLDKLQSGLDARKKVRDVPRDVERARDELVRCLRVNDRRPLDCWAEVQNFKEGVARMEEKFIRDVL